MVRGCRLYKKYSLCSASVRTMVRNRAHDHSGSNFGEGTRGRKSPWSKSGPPPGKVLKALGFETSGTPCLPGLRPPPPSFTLLGPISALLVCPLWGPHCALPVRSFLFQLVCSGPAWRFMLVGGGPRCSGQTPLASLHWGPHQSRSSPKSTVFHSASAAS